MKIGCWMLLTILILLAGCAEGYQSQGPAYQEEETMKLYRNPETDAEKANRIWMEESHP